MSEINLERVTTTYISYFYNSQVAKARNMIERHSYLCEMSCVACSFAGFPSGPFTQERFFVDVMFCNAL